MACRYASQLQDRIKRLEDRLKQLEQENDAMRADLLLWNEKEVRP
jgi:hypothetical protein